jgi:hypothetical protein
MPRTRDPSIQAVSLFGRLLLVLASTIILSFAPHGTHGPYFCASRLSS